MYEHLEQFGEKLMVDGKAVRSYATKPGRSCSCHVCFGSGTDRWDCYASGIMVWYPSAICDADRILFMENGIGINQEHSQVEICECFCYNEGR